MPKDYVSRARQSNAGKSKRSVSPRRKPKQARSQAKRRAAERGKNFNIHLPWRPILLLIVLVTVIMGGWHFLKEHSEAAEGVPVVNAKAVPLVERKKLSSTAATDILPKGPLKPVAFQFQPLDQTSSKKASYILQLGTYTEGDPNLQTLTESLEGANIKYHVEPFERAGQSLVRVEIGPFKQQSQAKKTQNQLLQQQIYSIIKEFK